MELCESQAASLVTIDNEDSYEFITLTSVSSWSSNWFVITRLVLIYVCYTGNFGNLVLVMHRYKLLLLN